MKIIYEAYDGKRFEDEDECCEYEAKLAIMENDILQNDVKCFDETGHLIPIEEVVTGIDESAYFIWFKNEHAIKTFKANLSGGAITEYCNAMLNTGYNVYMGEFSHRLRSYECWLPISFLESYIIQCDEIEEREGL